VGLFLLIRALRRGAAQSGRQEVIIEHQKGALDAIDKAKRVAEAARSGSDSAWVDRVLRKYRRP
jgi:hypothetical protein